MSSKTKRETDIELENRHLRHQVEELKLKKEDLLAHVRRLTLMLDPELSESTTECSGVTSE